MRLDPHQLQQRIHETLVERRAELVSPTGWKPARIAEIATTIAVQMALEPITPDPAPSPSSAPNAGTAQRSPAGAISDRARLLDEIREWATLTIPDPTARDAWIDGRVRDAYDARYADRERTHGHVVPARTLSDLSGPELERLLNQILALAEGVTS